GNESLLILDPDVDSYYCMDAVIFRLPKLNHDISRLRAQGANTLLLDLGADTTRKEQLKLFSVIVEESLTTQQDNMNYGLAANKDLESKLLPLLQLTNSYTKDFLDKVSNDIVQATPAKTTATQVFESATKVIDSNFGLYDSTISSLDELLRIRISGFEGKR